MLYISKEQMAKADEKARVHFHRRLRDYVRKKLPEQTDSTPDSKLLAYIAEQDKIAGEHEIKTEQGVAKWVCLSLGFGDDFFQEPPIKDYFNSPGLPDAETKLAVLVDCLYARKQNPDVKLETVFAEHGFDLRGL